MADKEMTISEFIQNYSRMRSSSRADAYWGGCLAVYSLSEMIGPILGWPTISGQLYILFGFGAEFPGLAQMLGVLLLQLAIEGIAGYKLWHTNWPTWIVLRVRRLPKTSLPEPNMRETALGLLTGLVLSAILGGLFQHVPAQRWPLIWFELGIFVLTAVVVVLALLLPDTVHHSVAHPDNVVFERIPKVFSPVQVVPNRTAFQKSILLRKLAGHYEARNFDGPIRLDECEHVLINYGVYEKDIAAPVKVNSANVFQCEGKFSLDVHPPPQGELVALQTRGVEILINNLYTQHDFFHFLSERLTAAMHVYAGAFDSEVKAMPESFGLTALQSELGSSRGFMASPQTLGAALNVHSAHLAELDVVHQRLERGIRQLEDYKAKWQGARNLQRQAVLALPGMFEQSLLKYFTDKLNGTDLPAESSIVKLLAWARIRFFVSKFDFTPAAAKAEALLDEETSKLRVELRTVEQKISTARSAQAAELRAMLRTKFEQIDPRTPRGSELLDKITRLLLMDDRAVLEQGHSLLTSLPRAVPAVRVIEGASSTQQEQPGATLPDWLRSHNEGQKEQNRPAPAGPSAKTDNNPSSDKAPSKPKSIFEEPF